MHTDNADGTLTCTSKRQKGLYLYKHPSPGGPHPPLTTETRFAEHGHLRVPARCGIYLVPGWRGPLYVGRATDLQARFLQHLERPHNAGLWRAVMEPFGPVRFVFGQIAEEQLPSVEAEAIRVLAPAYNAHS